jgi:hypothetical protein
MRTYIVLKLVQLAQLVSGTDCMRSVKNRIVMDRIMVSGDWNTSL